MTLLVSLGLIVAIALLGLVLQVVATLTAVPSPAIPQGDVSASRATWVQYLGVVGLLVGFIYTAMSYRLSRQSRVADAFVSAVRDLGDRESNVRRVGGIYALSILAAQEPENRDDIERVVSVFVREHSRGGSEERRPEVLEALSLVGRRPAGTRGKERRLDLRGVDLQGVSLYGWNLENCNLSGAQLSGADLTDVNLTGALLTGSKLDGASLRGAVLLDAHLDDCSVEKTDFYAAKTGGISTEGSDMAAALNFSPAVET